MAYGLTWTVFTLGYFPFLENVTVLVPCDTRPARLRLAAHTMVLRRLMHGLGAGPST